MSLILVKDATNSKVRELECNSSGLLKVTTASPTDVSSLSTEATLSTMNSKITSCDTSSIGGSVAVTGTVACSHAALPLPAGAATQASLATVAACVTGTKLAVQSSAPVVSASHSFMWGSAGSPVAVLNELDAFSASVDVDSASKVSVFGASSNFGDELEVQISSDNTNWYELTGQFVSVDYASGHFGFVIDAPFSYIRLKKKGQGSGYGSDNLLAILSAK